MKVLAATLEKDLLRMAGGCAGMPSSLRKEASLSWNWLSDRPFLLSPWEQL
jgi:hypothetical protein